jgi:hypothetical protein
LPTARPTSGRSFPARSNSGGVPSHRDAPGNRTYCLILPRLGDNVLVPPAQRVGHLFWGTGNRSDQMISIQMISM